MPQKQPLVLDPTGSDHHAEHRALRARGHRHPDWHGENADLFDATRVTKDHLAFGHGVHFCLGAPLARLEVATALRHLFARFPDARLAVPTQELRPLPTLISNGHVALPVRLRPAEPPRPR